MIPDKVRIISRRGFDTTIRAPVKKCCPAAGVVQPGKAMVSKTIGALRLGSSNLPLVVVKFLFISHVECFSTL